MRCDRTQPACSRCLRRGSACQYPSSITRSTTPDGGASGDEQSSLYNSELGPDQTLPSEGVSSQNIEQELNDLIAFTDSLENESLGFTCDYLGSLQQESSLAPTTQDLGMPMAFLPQADASLAIVEEQELQAQRSRSACTASIPPAPTDAVRLLERPKLQPSAQRTAQHIFHTLKSYPVMMRQGRSPPFVHQSSVPSEIELLGVEPLSNCINLMRMVGGGVQGSRRLFWRNARQEIERMGHEVSRRTACVKTSLTL